MRMTQKHWHSGTQISPAIGHVQGLPSPRLNYHDSSAFLHNLLIPFPSFSFFNVTCVMESYVVLWSLYYKLLILAYGANK
jgi:hypothetical protein